MPKKNFLPMDTRTLLCVILPKKQAQRKAPCSIGIRTRRRYTTVLSSLLLMAFASCYKKTLAGFEALEPEEQKAQINSYSNGKFSKLMDFVFAHLDEFKIMLLSGETNCYQEFMHRVVAIDIQTTLQYIEKTWKRCDFFWPVDNGIGPPAIERFLYGPF